MCVTDIDQIFPREYVVAYTLNYAVFIASFVGVWGIGLPMATVASTIGTVFAFIACVLMLIGSSCILCCGPQTRDNDGKCQLTAALVLNAIATLLNFIAIWLIIWAWSVVVTVLAGIQCDQTISEEECELEVNRFRSVIAAIFWTTWLFVLFVTALGAYSLRVLLQAKRAMEAAALAFRNANHGNSQPPQPAVEAFPVVAGSVVASTAPAPPVYARSYAPGVEMTSINPPPAEARAGGQRVVQV